MSSTLFSKSKQWNQISVSIYRFIKRLKTEFILIELPKTANYFEFKLNEFMTVIYFNIVNCNSINFYVINFNCLKLYQSISNYFEFKLNEFMTVIYFNIVNCNSINFNVINFFNELNFFFKFLRFIGWEIERQESDRRRAGVVIDVERNNSNNSNNSSNSSHNVCGERGHGEGAGPIDGQHDGAAGAQEFSSSDGRQEQRHALEEVGSVLPQGAQRRKDVFFFYFIDDVVDAIFSSRCHDDDGRGRGRGGSQCC